MHRIEWIDRHDGFRDFRRHSANKYNPCKWYRNSDGLMVAAETGIYRVYLNVHGRKQGPFRMYIMSPGALPHDVVIT